MAWRFGEIRRLGNWRGKSKNIRMAGEVVEGGKAEIRWSDSL